jgi:hypothetical protein
MKRLTTFLAALGFAVAALAQELPAFEDIDQDSDGLISQAEASVVEGLDFASADTDQDGWLSREEYQQLS